jgi:SAM-dependent methyltransferase
MSAEGPVNTERWDENSVILIESPLSKLHRKLLLSLSRFSTLARKDAPLLDLGCGSGPFLTRFKAEGFSKLYGLEPDPALIANIPKGLADVREGKAEKLPFESGFFSTVWVYGVLHHLTGPDHYRAACREIERVLAPGGRVFIMEPGRYKVFRAIEELAGVLGLVSKTFKAFCETMDEERPLQHKFLKEHAVVREELQRLGLVPEVDTYFVYSWLYTARKPAA